MSYEIYIRSAAEQDVSEAQRWYEEQAPGLGARFNAEFAATVNRIAETPFLYPVQYRGIRRALLRSFPFLLWYRVYTDHVVVMACTHGKANPDAVVSRLDNA